MFRYTHKKYLFAFLLSSVATADEYTFWDDSPSDYSAPTAVAAPVQDVASRISPASSATLQAGNATAKPIVVEKPKPMILPNDKSIRLRASSNNPTIDKNLRVSLRSNYMKEAERWYGEGGNVDNVTPQGLTLLSQAIKSHHTAGIEFLLLRRADVNLLNANKSSALHIAVETGQARVVKLLLERNASVSRMLNNDTLIHKAMMVGNEEIALALLEKGVDISGRYEEGKTLLHIAASKGFARMTQGLLNRGADINATFNEGVTPLHLAASRGQIVTVRLLLSRNANIKASTAKNWRPLHHAARFGYGNVVTALIQKGASANTKTSDGKTPLALAKHLHHQKVVDILASRTSGGASGKKSGFFW